MYSIATLEDLSRHLGLARADASADASLPQKLQEASQLIESLTQRRYCPWLETRAAAPLAHDPSQLILPDDLLELREIRDAGGLIDLADIQRLPDDADAPASVLRLGKGKRFMPQARGEASIAITGIWGWHDRWTQAWRASGDSLQAGISASDASISVSDAAGSDSDGLSPRFQAMQLLRINDEYLRVIAIDLPKQRLTVQRGAQGTAASDHPLGARIETYVPALPIRDLTLRYAELMLRSQSPLADEPSSLLERMRRLTA